MFDSISDAMNISHEVVPANSSVKEAQKAINAESDFDYAREQIRNTIERTTEVFEEMIELAKMSEHPRSFEVVNQIAANLKDMSQALVKLHQDAAKTSAKSATPSTPQVTHVTNNALVLNSTEDLINMIRQTNKGGLSGSTIEG